MGSLHFGLSGVYLHGSLPFTCAVEKYMSIQMVSKPLDCVLISKE